MTPRSVGFEDATSKRHRLEGGNATSTWHWQTERPLLVCPGCFPDACAVRGARPVLEEGGVLGDLGCPNEGPTNCMGPNGIPFGPGWDGAERCVRLGNPTKMAA
jgi:hypothetical protein